MNELQRVAAKVEPQATLVAAWELKGGLAAQMTALEVGWPDGRRRKLIVRRPGPRALQLNPDAAAHEFRILQALQGLGVKTQTPYLLDESGEIWAQPYLVVEYIEGEAVYAPAAVMPFVEQMATQLAILARARGPQVDLGFLPRQAPRLDQVVRRIPPRLDESLQEGRIRAALDRVWPLSMGSSLVHGDFWPGNVLWHEGLLAAVIDWEDAEVGNPLYDLAVSRLDMLWLFGAQAMAAFTRRYQEEAGLDAGRYAQLPYWDLLAALRPAARIDEWAAGWPQLGRADVTAVSMRAAHEWFVMQAFGAI